MAVLEIIYRCRRCGEISPPSNPSMICERCGGDLIGEGAPGLNGTRDSFGVGKKFQDDNSGKTIDNWKSWEKSGYRNPLEATKNHNVREKIKRKIELIRGEHKK